jgi:hypothetical protein
MKWQVVQAGSVQPEPRRSRFLMHIPIRGMLSRNFRADIRGELRIGFAVGV